MSLPMFNYLASHTGSLRKVAQRLHNQFELEGVPEEALTSIQGIIDEANTLCQKLVKKPQYDAEISDVVENHAHYKAEWISLLNQLYQSANTLIHQFSLTENASIENTMKLLEEQQTGRFVKEEYTEEFLVKHLIARVKKYWSHSGEIFSDAAKKDIDTLLIHIAYLRETSQEQKAEQLVEQLVTLDIDHTPLSLAHAQILIKRGELNSAEQVISHILEKEPHNALAKELKVQISDMR